MTDFEKIKQLDFVKTLFAEIPASIDEIGYYSDHYESVKCFLASVHDSSLRKRFIDFIADEDQNFNISLEIIKFGVTHEEMVRSMESWVEIHEMMTSHREVTLSMDYDPAIKAMISEITAWSE